jgi:PPOX class probable F420-dependent enzyme
VPGPLLTHPAAAYLARQRVGHLATADAAGTPHVVPVCFALLDGTVYSVLDAKPKRIPGRSLRRVRNVLANPRAALVVDTYDEDWTRLGYVLVTGTTRLLEPSDPEHAPALAALRAKYPQYRAMPLASQPMIALDPTTVVAWGRTA